MQAMAVSISLAYIQPCRATVVYGAVSTGFVHNGEVDPLDPSAQPNQPSSRFRDPLNPSIILPYFMGWSERRYQNFKECENKPWMWGLVHTGGEKKGQVLANSSVDIKESRK